MNVMLDSSRGEYGRGPGAGRLNGSELFFLSMQKEERGVIEAGGKD